MQTIPEGRPMTPIRYDMGFGEAVAVRDTLANFYSPHMGEHHSILSIRDLGYPGTGPGLSELVEDMKTVIKNETGLQYKHVLVTAGAAQAISVVLKTVGSGEGPKWVRFSAPYFSHYPSIARLAGYTVFIRDNTSMVGSLAPDIELIDSPSNPEGKPRLYDSEPNSLPVWDATYANRVFSKIVGVHPAHKIMIGSFGKLLGLNGIRLGWIATNDDYLFDRLVTINYHMTLGVSVVSQRLVASILENIDMDQFTQQAALQIDCNREEMAKLEYLSSDDSVVSENGMFFWTKMDTAARKLLASAGVRWIEGKECGGADEHLRLNLAQSRKLTKDMVKAVRRIDGKV